MAERRNQLALLTEQELQTGLEIAGTAESASAVASQVYAIPVEDQSFFEWVDSALMLVSCVSGELAQRIAEFFGTTAELRTQIEQQQREFLRWVDSSQFKRGGTPLCLEDVVFDTRTEPPVSEARGSGS